MPGVGFMCYITLCALIDTYLDIVICVKQVLGRIKQVTDFMTYGRKMGLYPADDTRHIEFSQFTTVILI